VPTGPEVGVKPVSVGVEITAKFVALVTLPPGPVTVIGPLVAPAGTLATICVSLEIMKTAGWPLKLTAVAPLKFVPVKVTLLPARPEAGEKLVSVGTGMTVKLEALVTTPAGLVTVIGPVVAPAGTVATICVSLEIENAAA
jgi:hypothetical protein